MSTHDPARAVAPPRLTREQLAGSFTSGADRYAALRPGYPPPAVAWLVAEGCRAGAQHPSPALDIVDVGAGTGKLTEVLLRLGHRVTAVEPSQDMLAQLRSAYPHLPTRLATGEGTGLAERSQDVVTYGQSWHWADPVAATREADRILRPGGVLGLIWNFMDHTDPRIAAVEAAMHSLDGGVSPTDDSARAVAAPFLVSERREFTSRQPMTTRSLADLVTTRSYYLARPQREQAELRRRVDAAVAAAFGSVGEEVIEVRHVTMAHAFRRIDIMS